MNKIMALIAFFASTLVYYLTAQPSVSFWDCGEFAGASYYLQVPHPPGAPLFLLIGRIFMMIPFAENLGFRMNMVSVLSSGLTVMFLYLVTVKLINFWRKEEVKNISDFLSVNIPALLGALTFAVTDTFWFNAVESEVYAISMLFVSALIWLILVWYEKADEPNSERFLLLISFLIGLSIGVHLLSVLAILSFIMIIYFRKYEFRFDTFIVMGIISVVSFFIVYPGIVKYFPSLMGKFAGDDLTLKLIFFFAVLFGLFYAMVWTKKKNYSYAFLGITSIFLIFIGYTIYTMVIIRSNSNPPMNENQPDTINKLVYYIGREQYGDFPVFKRRYSNEPHQQGIYTNYSSDLDFMWRYQINHMFNRYFFWNFVGREGDIQDAKAVLFGNGNEEYRMGTDAFPNKYWGIPLLLGIFGLFWHFKKDWKMGLSFLSLFLLMGILTALYQNQQEPQPRERDYFYVGAFFIFAVWIGIAFNGLIELIRTKINNLSLSNLLVYVIILFGILTGPVNLAYQNWDDHDRSNNYIPWDFAYNLLQSCEPNGILIVNGDNDTFPLWYLQDVEEVRRDVRIVNLSLANTDWYVMQLKHQEPYGALKVPISMTDQQIKSLTPMAYEPTHFKLPVSKEVIERYAVKDTQIINTGYIDWLVPSTISQGDIKGIRIQDLVMKDIIETNARLGWQRPIHYSITCSEDTKLNLQPYMIMQGMTYKLTPVKNPTKVDNIDVEKMKACLFNENEGYSKEYKLGFKYRGFKEGNLYLDENQRRMMLNFRTPFFRLAEYQLDYLRDKQACVATLDIMEKLIPRKNIFIDYRILFDVSKLYLGADAWERYDELTKEIEQTALRQIELNPAEAGGYYSPYAILLNIYETKKEYNKSVDLLTKLLKYYPGDPTILNEIQRLRNIINKPITDTSATK